MTEQQSDVAAALEYAENHLLVDQIAGAPDTIWLRERQVGGGEQWKEISTRDPNRPPERITGTTDVHTARSFIDAVKRWENPGQITYLDVPGRRIVTVLNPHRGVDLDPDPSTATDFGDHRVAVALRHTPEWEFWTTHEGLRDQEAFAEVIEHGEDEIVDPTATTMLAIAQNLHATVDGQFKSQRRLSDGSVSLQYEEAIQMTGGNGGVVTVPTEFKIGVAPFVGSRPYEVRCRLRTRLRSGVLSIGYELVRPDTILELAFKDISDQIVAEIIGAVLEGPIPR